MAPALDDPERSANRRVFELTWWFELTMLASLALEWLLLLAWCAASGGIGAAGWRQAGGAEAAMLCGCGRGLRAVGANCFAHLRT